MVWEKKTRLAVEINTADVQKAELSFRALGTALNKLQRKKQNVDHPLVSKFMKTSTQKMLNMVYAFSLNVYDAAVAYTPIGDATRINKSTDRNYYNMYFRRYKDHGIAMSPGYHKGSWQFSTSKNAVFNSNIQSQSSARSNFIAQMHSGYTVGSTIYVSAIGPGFNAMEKGWNKSTPDGVVQPTLDLVMAIYQIDLAAAYKKKGVWP